MPTPQNRRPSFHRRILPWIYIVAFLAIAPSVIFYTSGYRYNTKKGKIERYSTLIVDSNPTSATLLLDEQDTKDVTPSTIQTVTPGTHTLSVSKVGYTSWQKTLEMDAERATFATDVWLWKISEPNLRYPQRADALTASPDGATILRVNVATSTTIFASDPIGTSIVSYSMEQPLVAPIRWFWSTDSKRVLFENSTSTWLLDLQTHQPPLLLPSGTYRWSQNAVIGTNGTTLTTISLPTLAITQTTLPLSSFDQTENGDELRTATGTIDRIYVRHDDPLKGLVLPNGKWTFWKSSNTSALFRDASHWLSIQTSTDTPTSHTLASDSLLTIPGTSDQPYLGIQNGELWTWNPIEDPQLLYRQSEPIIDATWHHAGHDIFFATPTSIYALDLDPRDGRIQTLLATFDHVTNLTVAGKELFIAATKNAQTGVWALKVE